jgi:hypothetical protein
MVMACQPVKSYKRVHVDFCVAVYAIFGFCDGILSPDFHIAYLRAVQSRRSRQVWKSASVRLVRNIAHAASKSARALAYLLGGATKREADARIRLHSDEAWSSSSRMNRC